MAQKVRRFYVLCAILTAGLFFNAAVFFGEIRYRAPLDPLLAILLAVGLVKLIRQVVRTNKKPAPVDAG